MARRFVIFITYNIKTPTNRRFPARALPEEGCEACHGLAANDAKERYTGKPRGNPWTRDLFRDFPRGGAMVRHHGIRLVPLGVCLFLLSCTSGDTPTSTNAIAPVAIQGTAFVADSARKAAHDSLMDALKQEKDRLKEERRLHHAEFEQARREWNLWKRAQAELKKHNSGYVPELLRCEPQEFAGDAEVIGPKGGSLRIGDHELRIPVGALDHDVLISGTAPVSDVAEVDLQPEGLHFDKPAELELSYRNCVQPPDWVNVVVVYLGNNDQILEVNASVDKKGLKSVVGSLAHFSRYAVAW
jgi:hypothetical protein